jgi:hypothetical protein
MGMDLTVSFRGQQAPAWPAVVERLAGRGLAVQMRMIDGELAFPDEAPPESWRELRVAVGDCMVTARRSTDGVTLVTWGNADAAGRRAWHALAWAFAEAGSGLVQTEAGEVDAAAFAAQAGLRAP